MAALAPTPTPVRAALIGVTGRMGEALLRAAPAVPRLRVTAAVASPRSLSLGRDAGEVAGVGCLHVPIISDLPRALAEADVAIDFSSATATLANLAACRAARKPLLIGTTGFAAELDGAFAAAARDIPLLVAANTSLGVTLLLELVRIAARALPAAFDINILDTHHRSKQDAPSAPPGRRGQRHARRGRRPGTERIARATSALPPCAPETSSGSTRCSSQARARLCP